MQTGEYSMSSEYRQRISDLSSWTMSPDFFDRFPEMYSDIPAFQTIPASLFWTAPEEGTQSNGKERAMGGTYPLSVINTAVELFSELPSLEYNI